MKPVMMTLALVWSLAAAISQADHDHGYHGHGGHGHGHHPHFGHGHHHHHHHRAFGGAFLYAPPPAYYVAGPPVFVPPPVYAPVAVYHPPVYPVPAYPRSSFSLFGRGFGFSISN